MGATNRSDLRLVSIGGAQEDGDTVCVLIGSQTTRPCLLAWLRALTSFQRGYCSLNNRSESRSAHEKHTAICSYLCHRIKQVIAIIHMLMMYQKDGYETHTLVCLAFLKGL